MQYANAGLRRYFAEYMIARTINRTGELRGTPIVVSQARYIRDDVGRRLVEKGTSLNNPSLDMTDLMTAIDQAMGDRIEGYRSFFPGGVESKGYKALLGEFNTMIGRNGNPGPGGTRVPISPYDPRWRMRQTVMRHGSDFLYALNDDIEAYAGGKAGNLERITEEVNLYSIRDGREREAGKMLTLSDISGLSELAPRMTSRELNDVTDWVLEGALNPATNQYQVSKFMTPEAVARARRILDMLAEEGIPYTIEKDSRPGQIKACLTGTLISVRLTDTRESEKWVGRIYDNGAITYFSTSVKSPSNKYLEYTPSVDEVCDLIRLTMGRPLTNEFGKFVGENTLIENFEGEYLNAYVNSGMSSVYKEMPGYPGEHVMIRRNVKNRSVQSRFFGPDGDSELRAVGFISDAVASARANVRGELNIDSLISQFNENREAAIDGTYIPEITADTDLSLVARAYWDVLRGENTTLLKPEATREEYVEATDILDDMSESSDIGGIHDMLAGTVAYTGTPEEKIRAHIEDLLNEQIGIDYDQGFDPVRVGRYMSSEYGQWRNNDDLVAAMRRVNYDVSKIKGETFYADAFRDRLIRFDDSRAQDMLDSSDSFIREMGETINTALKGVSVRPESIRVDDKGVVEWYGQQTVSGKGRTKFVSGQIGQIFTRGRNGEIVTQFNSGSNVMIVPGYEARVVAQKAGEAKTLEERTRLRGYEDVMRDAIAYTIQNDVLTGRSQVGEPASLNSVYRGLSDTRHSVDHYQRAMEEGMDMEMLDAILASEARRVRYPNAFRNGSTVDAESRAKKARDRGWGIDETNDMTMDPWILSGVRNMAVVGSERELRGYFDPMMTSGGTNQGIVRYLVESARVENGEIIRGREDDRAPLMNLERTRFMGYDPFDRQQMTVSNLMNAAGITKPVQTAFTTVGGWTMEDSIVVSSDFARKYQIRGIDGRMRDLRVGDKISDFHGNKGVISLVVDRHANLSEAEAIEKHGSTHMQELFVNNPGLDVVMAPFSAVSRFNGGSTREAMQQTTDLHTPDGRIVEDGIGEVSFIVTHMAVDAKTKVYDDAAIRQGQGRKASSQLAWALQAQECDKVLGQFYGGNDQAIATLREMLLVAGMDIEADGTLRIGHDDLAEGESRRFFELGSVPLNSKGTFDVREVRRRFGRQIGQTGGDMELPFPLVMATGEQTPAATDMTWKLPVMSSHLRSGQDLADGTSTTHDYTNRYLLIHEMAMRYVYAHNLMNEGGDPVKAREEMDKCVRRAQSSYDSLMYDLKTRRFSGKHNFFKEGVMSSRLARSATAVWSGDPRLDIDQIGVGGELARKLNLRDGDYALVWRDPILRDGGVRYMRVKVDPEIVGASVNPNAVATFDGDFDGDSVAIVNIGQSGPVFEQAKERLTFAANLLDFREGTDDVGRYKLGMHNALDVKVSQHEDSRHAEAMEDVLNAANDNYMDFSEGEITRAEYVANGERIVQQISAMYKGALENQYCGATVSFGSTKQNMESIIHSCIETGAKGSMSKMTDYAKYLGCDPQTYEDLGQTQATVSDFEGTAFATAVKSHSTGKAGAHSQRGVKHCRDSVIKPSLEVTSAMTQALLQAKHDPVDAARRDGLINGPVRDVMRGAVVELINGEWQAKYDERGFNYAQVTKDEWSESFINLYTSKSGLDMPVNEDYIHALAKHLSDENGFMLDPQDPENADRLGITTLDRLAYGGDFDTLVDCARNKRNIFDGQWNATFAPRSVRKYLEDPVAAVQAAPIAHVDTLQLDVERIGRRKSTPMATPVGRFRISQMEADRQALHNQSDEVILDDGYSMSM